MYFCVLLANCTQGGDQKRVLNFLELVNIDVSHYAMWALGTNPRSPTRPASAFDY